MLCLCHYGPALLGFDLKLTLDAKIQPVFLKVQAVKTLSYHGRVIFMCVGALVLSTYIK